MGWEHAIRGMRNPMNSWEKSDSRYNGVRYLKYCDNEPECFYTEEGEPYVNDQVIIGPNDQDLMMRLAKSGTDHRKFMRMITVYVDITAPLYWWKEFDTYKVGTVSNSCSTMHKIHAKEFTIDDFSHEHLEGRALNTLEEVVDDLNYYREYYLSMESQKVPYADKKAKEIWWQMIQLLPSSYNQRRTVMLNYEVLANIYRSRKNHKLDEWHDFCHWIEGLPYSEIITGAKEKRYVS